MITLKINVPTAQDYYSQTVIVQCMKLKRKISIKILAARKKFLISVIITLKSKLSQNTTLIQNN